MVQDITNGKKRVNEIYVDTKKGEIVDANVLGVEVGTNGYMGGDTGHGSRTFIRIENLGGTDMNAQVVYDEHTLDAKSVTIKLGGDAELRTMIEALKFIVETLENQTKEDELC